MEAFSFIHAADLHLDSPFVGLGRLPEEHQQIARALRQATFTAFEALVSLCIQEQVDFLVIAGDVYDGADRSLQAQLRFRDGLRRLSRAGIRAFVTHGNHDPLDGWAESLEMPPEVHKFGAELESVAYHKHGCPVARIHGISYPTRIIAPDFGRGFKREGEEPFQIGILHCNAGGNPLHDPYAPRSVNDLVAAGLDYWALGHVHESMVLRTSDPFIGYPGNTQGRHVNECGPRGCFLARVGADGKLESEPTFVATDAVRWMCSEVDIGAQESIDDLLTCTEDLLEEIAAQAGRRPLVVGLTLVGRGPLHDRLCRPNAGRDLLDELRLRFANRSEFIWVKNLCLQTRPETNIDALRSAPDFLGDLLRLFEEVRRSPEEQAQLRSVLAELYDQSRVRRHFAPPDVDAVKAFLDEAEIRCVDLLLEDQAS